MLTTKLEVLVDFGPKPDQNIVNKTLDELNSKSGIEKAVFKDGAILVETNLPSNDVLDMVTKTSGKRAVLQGFGDSQSAVAMISSQSCCGDRVLGVVRLQQTPSGLLLADGSIDGLTEGLHGIHVRESGDLSEGCGTLGGHYNPFNSPHGAPEDPPDKRHAGDLGNIAADQTGRASFRIVDNVLKLDEIIGRSVAITERRDDLGRGQSPTSSIDGDSGRTIACGIIARSAGIFQNPKRICQCDGVVVWDEQNVPIAGRARRADRCCTREGDGAKPCCKV